MSFDGREPPPHVADAIFSAILEGLDATGDDPHALDLAALLDRFPEHEAWISDVVDRLRSSKRPRRFGPYVLGRVLGEGAQGYVQEAWDPGLGRAVAIKLLNRHGLTDRTRLEREAAALGALDHPHIVKVHHLAEDDGVIGIVMELVRGASLDRVLVACRDRATSAEGAEADVTLTDLVDAEASAASDASTQVWLTDAEAPTRDEAEPEEEPPTSPSPLDSASDALGGPWFRAVAKIMADAATGLHHAHEAGLIHRDVKPGNLLIDRDLRVRVTDFGLVRSDHASKVTHSGLLVATPAYCSPEQASFEPLTPATDIWSLGATLYELVTLSLPFPGADASEILYRVRRQRPQPPRRLARRLPDGLESIILRCLERQPEHRYTTALELAEDLRRFVAGEAVRAHSVLRRIRRVGAGTIVAAVLAVAVMGLKTAIDNARSARRLERLQRIAEQNLRHRLDSGDQAQMTQAVSDAVQELKYLPEDPVIRARVLRIAARVAREQGDLERVARTLTAKAAIDGLQSEERLWLARARFAGREWKAATHAYTHPDVDQPDELRLLSAFATGATSDRLPFPVSRAFPAPHLEGLGPSFVIFEDRSSHSTHLRIYEISTGRTGRWTVQDPRTSSGLEQVAGVGVFDLDGDGRDEVYAVGVEKPPALPGEDAPPPHLWIARGPFDADTSPRWRSMPTPGVVVGDECWIVGFPKAEGRPAMTVLNRARSGARVWLDDDGAHLHSGWNWTWRSDLEMLHATTFGQRPALLRCQGPWTDWDVHLDVPGPLGHLVSTASTTPGAVRDAQVVRVDDREYVIAINGGAETYLSHFRFGFATPYGWPFGIQVMEVDQATRQLNPVTRLRLPRPTHSGSRILLADVLPSRPGPEVLLFDRHDVNRQHTLVASLRHDDEGRITLEPRLRLPGCVCAAIEVNGKQVLCVSWDEESASLVTLE